MRTILIFMLVPWSALGATAEPLTLRDAVVTSLKSGLDIRLNAADSRSAIARAQEAAGEFDLNVRAGASSDDNRYPAANSQDGATVSVTKTAAVNAAVAKKFGNGTEVSLPWAHNVITSNSSFLIYSTRHEPSLRLDIKHPLVKGLFPSYGSKDLVQADMDALIAQEKFTEQVMETSLRTMERYWALLSAREGLRIGELASRKADETLEFAQHKLRAGMASQVDVLDAEAAALRARDTLIRAQADLATRKQELALAVYADPSHEFQVPDALPIPATNDFRSTGTVDEAIASATSSRPDIRRATLAVEKAERARDAAKLDLIPALDLSGGAGFRGLSNGFASAEADMFKMEHFSWNAALKVSHPLFMRASKGALAKRELELQQERIREQQTRRTLEIDIRKNWRGLEAGWERLTAAQKVVHAESEKLEARRQQFRLGRSSAWELVEAEQAKYQADLDLVKAAIGYQRSGYGLARTRGLLLEQLGVKFDDSSFVSE